MQFLEIVFWLLLFIVVYTYVGYGIVLYAMVKIKRLFGSRTKQVREENYQPEITLFIAAYNEKEYVAAKMKNSLELDYPKDNLTTAPPKYWVPTPKQLYCISPNATEKLAL
jgi:cellulose synthase/poly-beta-1,6-N-acetylglucosamine synthase-like glycosyltransferase